MANILSFKTDPEIAQILADWVTNQRLKQNLTQRDIAQRANIAGSTYKRFEQTGEISLLRFISVLRSLGRLDTLNILLETDKGPSPMEKLAGKPKSQRKRARRKSTGKSS